MKQECIACRTEFEAKDYDDKLCDTCKPVAQNYHDFWMWVTYDCRRYFPVNDNVRIYYSEDMCRAYVQVNGRVFTIIPFWIDDGEKLAGFIDDLMYNINAWQVDKSMKTPFEKHNNDDGEQQ